MLSYIMCCGCAVPEKSELYYTIRHTLISYRIKFKSKGIFPCEQGDKRGKRRMDARVYLCKKGERKKKKKAKK